MTVETTSEERIERLKALLVGQSTSRRARAALASAPEDSKNLLLGVMLHGANRLQEGRILTRVEQALVDALETVIDTEEVKEWGRAYRETVESVDQEQLIIPRLIAQRRALFGYTIYDLKAALPQLAREASEAPNVSVVSLEDLAAGRVEEDEAFVEAMRETGFAVTGTRLTRYDSASNSGALAESATAGRSAAAAEVEPWRVRLDMKSFYVKRAVGDQGGGRDEIYFTAASGVAGERGRPSARRNSARSARAMSAVSPAGRRRSWTRCAAAAASSAASRCGRPTSPTPSGTTSSSSPCRPPSR